MEMNISQTFSTALSVDFGVEAGGGGFDAVAKRCRFIAA
jgi:hypothetical protein